MAQANILLPFKKLLTNALAPATLDPAGLLSTTNGGLYWTQVTAAAVIKATPGRLARLVIIAPGSGSLAFTLNDCAKTTDAAAGNQIWSLAFGASANVAGAVFSFDWPCQVGLVCSAVPGAGSPIINVSWA